jgi:ADP-heptose:LPS heptosyltransferase
MASLKNKEVKMKPMTLKNFFEKRNKVLIWHNQGGLGDALMLRMLIDDFKKLCPDSELFVACLPEYMDAIRDHPCVSQVLDAKTIDLNDFSTYYNTCVSIVDRYESNQAPNCKDHRSDIWAKYCGFKLESHNMNLHFSRSTIEKCKNKINFLIGEKTKPILIFCPTSKMMLKTLLTHQIEAVIEETKNCHVIGLHNKEIPELKKLGIPIIYDANIKEWMTYIALADYVISVDTAAFHMAGGLKKPLLGIFTFADGKVYGKYFDFVLVQKHRDNKNWDCGPCFKFHLCPKTTKQQKPCLTEISNCEIKLGIKELFNRWPVKNNNFILK